MKLKIISEYNLLVMKVIEHNLEICGDCGYPKGYINEQNNSIVPVLCWCDLTKNGRLRSLDHQPSITTRFYHDKFIFVWTPTCNFINENGEYIHVPGFEASGYWPDLRKYRHEVQLLMKEIKYLKTLKLENCTDYFH